MTHDGRNGTDVNRGRAQVGLTCTRSANGEPRFPAFVSDPAVLIGPPPRRYAVGARRSFAITPRNGGEGEKKKKEKERMINLSKANLCSG